MTENEVENVKKYLIEIIKKEENTFDKDVKEFYVKYAISPSIIKIKYFKNKFEPFFLILKYKDYGIYFNDIEETFGICKLFADKCLEHNEFYDDLKPTIIKMMSSRI